MAQYYTLDEAARVLQTSPEEVRKLADDKKLRTFRDKGTLRFRAQEIDELAREMGIGSDPDLQLGDVPAPRKGNSPVPAKRPSKLDRTKSKLDKPKSKLDKPQSKVEKPKEDDSFDFSLSLDEEEEQVSLGSLPPASQTGSKGSKKSMLGPSSPAPKPGSDSGVRLVPDGNEDLTLPMDEPKSAPKSAPRAPTSPPPKKKSKLSKLAAPDSGVRIVPLDPSDSDVKMVLDTGGESVNLGADKPSSASDSDIRLEQLKSGAAPKPGSSAELVTEEIDLDAEISKLGPATPPPPSKRSSTPKLPTSSPFELSEEDLGVDDAPKSEGGLEDSSGDFELTLDDSGGSSPIELGSDEMPAAAGDDEEVSLGELTDSGSGGSGINLRDPADSGISLEQEGADDLGPESDLTLDAGATPPPKKKKKGGKSKIEPKAEEDSSEFELSLEDESSETISAESSEFELSLDDSGSSELELDLEPVEQAGEDSDSEFELTLDDSGGSSPLDEDAGEGRDIFETDFEVPALEEESGSEAVALDDESTDVESSEFDLAIDEMDVGAEDESGSQVVALEDEEDAEAEPQPRRKSKLLHADEDEDAGEFAGIGGPLEEEDEDEVASLPGGKVRVEYVEKPPAPWGPVPALLMLPCMIVLFLVGLMGFELVTGMVSYQKTGKFSGLLIRPLTEALTGEDLPGGTPKKK